LYQLRGRVGRAQHKAYAYLMLPPGLMTVGEARRRINAIKQYSSLGAGFKIAMRDLEIRGAGNILGTQQSGHIVNIGFDLYCSLLKQAVSRMKGDKVQQRVEVVLKLDFVALREAEFVRGKARRDQQRAAARKRTRAPKAIVHAVAIDAPQTPAFIPASYIGESQPRIQAYRRLAEIGSPEQLESFRKTWRDRFGPLPDAAENLLLLTDLKISAAARKISVVEVREEKVMLSRTGAYIQIGGKFPRLTANDPAERIRELISVVRAF
jgi:transcription-repair coupling factor (superfamily II helicase)